MYLLSVRFVPGDFPWEVRLIQSQSTYFRQRTIRKLQAALQPVSSSDKLELVDQLTDYVSDALAEVKCRMLLPALQ